MSTPSRFTVSNCVPILGLTKARMKQLKAKLITINLRKGLKRERLGLKTANSEEEEKLAWVFFFQLLTHK